MDNAKKYADKGRGDIRRTDRQVEEETWIKDLLETSEIAVIATAHENQPFVTPINYVYIEADHALYFHSAHVGRMRANMSLNPQVCINVFEMGKLYAGKRTSEFGLEYKSVTVFGTANLVEDKEKVYQALQALMDKHFPDHKPGVDYEPIQEDEVKRTAIYKIAIDEWTGKQLKGSD